MRDHTTTTAPAPTEGTLCLDAGKSTRVTFADLQRLPDPVSMGPRHRPVPHHHLITAILTQIAAHGFVVRREQYAVKAAGAQLFGVLDLVKRTEAGTIDCFSPSGDAAGRSTWSLGLRASTDQALAEQLVAGSRVFVCDNLLLSGDSILLKHKSTTNFDVERTVIEAFRRYLDVQTAWADTLQAMAEYTLSARRAKEVIYDLIATETMPARLLTKVDAQYFHATDEQPDCQPRTVWGLQNAVTRVVKDLNPTRSFDVTQDVGRRFAALVRQ
jgi:hypothetical protein